MFEDAKESIDQPATSKNLYSKKEDGKGWQFPGVEVCDIYQFAVN